MMEFNEIAAHDEFVDSWSDNTKTAVPVHILNSTSGWLDDGKDE
jgi:hypothetical protein